MNSKIVVSAGLFGAIALGSFLYAAQPRKAVEFREPEQKLATDIKPKQDSLSKDDATTIISYLSNASEHGLKPINLSDISASLNSGNALDDAQKAKLKEAAIEYGKELYGSRIKWSKAPDDWDMRPKTPDLSTSFDEAVKNNQVKEWLDSLIPPQAAYTNLFEARKFYDKASRQGGFLKVADMPQNMKIGMTDPRIGQLRTRLAQENYVALNATAPNTLDQGLVNQINNFQTTHLIKPDIQVGKRTLEAINVSADDRLRQIDLNLERERWVPRDNPPTRLEANIPTQILVYYENNKPILEMRTIVGALKTKTPSFASEVRAVILNPPWYKPESIKGDERIQPPGPKNSLGRVKFDMVNRHSVYLHDTPNHALFGGSHRTLSHGCVRLNQPKDLAELLLKPEGVTREKIEEITKTTNTKWYNLKVKPTVFILYRTAYVTFDGNHTPFVNFTDDIYSWDKQLEELLYKPDSNTASGESEVSQKAATIAAP